MTDIVDQAQALEQRLREEAIERARSHGVVPRDAAGPRDCADCGDPISPARLAAQPAATRCLFCQGQAEGRP